MRKAIIALAIIFLTGCAAWQHIESPSNYRDGHFKKYDQRMAEKNQALSNGPSAYWR